jgi:tol-pal system protein YbgF
MRQIATRTVVGFALVLLVMHPAQAADKETRQMMADIRILQEQSQQLQNLIGSLNTALAEALKAVNGRLDEQANATRKGLADQKLVIDNLSSDLRIVREKVDDSNVRISSLSQELDALRQSVQQQATRALPATPESLEAAAAPGVAPPEPTAAPSAPPGPPPAAGTSPTRLYDLAFSDYTSGQWDLAIQGFDSYIRSFPRSDRADDAQVLIGNSYLQAGKNDKAAEAYDKAIRTYPAGDAIPEAYYKKGLALRNLKQLDQACEAFSYAVKNYPDSPAGQLAKQQINQLSGPACK